MVHRTHESLEPGRVLLTCVGVLWAAFLTVLGLRLLDDGPGPISLPTQALRAGGAAALAGGQFVFMVLVSDRWFPHAHRGLVLAGEACAVLCFTAAMVLAAAGAWMGA